MGWLYGWKSRNELVAHLVDEPTAYRTLAHRRRARAASRFCGRCMRSRPDGEKAGERFIVCYLVGYDRRDGTFGYKDMGESCGPCYYSCPLSYLDMVPQPQGEFVQGWRDKVREFHAQVAARKQFVKTLKVGDTLKQKDRPDTEASMKVEPRTRASRGFCYGCSLTGVLQE